MPDARSPAEPPTTSPPVVVAATGAAEETRELAGAVAGVARAGDLIVLTGDLGAGKTTFCQGFGRGLGVTGRITSPTFTLVHTYEGRLRMHHLDVYRLDQLDETADLGLGELLDEGAVTLIEWGDTIAPVLPRDYLQVRILLGEGDDDRRWELEVVGPGWAARTDELAAALGPWIEAVR